MFRKETVLDDIRLLPRRFGLSKKLTATWITVLNAESLIKGRIEKD